METINDQWIRNEHYKNEVSSQTQIKQNEINNQKIERADLYIDSFMILVWLAGSVLVWLFLERMLPAFSIVWSIIAILVFSYFSLLLLWKLYKLWIV
jgi:hypothetical protein